MSKSYIIKVVKKSRWFILTKDLKDRRNKRVNFVASENEIKQYQQLADKKGLTLSSYLRLLLSTQLTKEKNNE